MSQMWIDGRLHDLEEIGVHDRALLASRMAPTARLVLRNSWLQPGGVVDGSAWIQKVAAAFGLALDAAEAPVSGVAHSDERVLVLVGPRLEDVVRGPSAAEIASVTLWPVPPSDGPAQLRPVRLVTSPWPINQLSPVASLLLASDGEYAASQRMAADAGADDALVYNLVGDVARAGRSAVFLMASSEHVVTPDLESAAPDSPWRNLAVAALGAVETRVRPSDLLNARAVVAVSEAGYVRQVRQVDDRRLPAADELGRLVEAALDG